MHIKAQNGSFDVPSRIFASIPLAYDLAASMIADYRELIPEFFYDSSFLLNTNRFKLGELRDEIVDDVVLPPWAHQNAAEFVYMSRKALECEFVGQHMYRWIDLISGCKQIGQTLLEANNAFHRYLYENLGTVPSATDPEMDQEIETMLDSCGQIPRVSH
jgi:hypothetical protein